MREGTHPPSSNGLMRSSDDRDDGFQGMGGGQGMVGETDHSGSMHGGSLGGCGGGVGGGGLSGLDGLRSSSSSDDMLLKHLHDKLLYATDKICRRAVSIEPFFAPRY